MGVVRGWVLSGKGVWGGNTRLLKKSPRTIRGEGSGNLDIFGQVGGRGQKSQMSAIFFYEWPLY